MVVSRSIPAVALALALSGVAVVGAAAQVPSFREVVGHDFGERITRHHEMMTYLRRLSETSPRVTVVEQGTSWEGRSLGMAIVTAPENHAGLDAIQQTAQRLGDPRRLPPEEAETLFPRQPVIVWYGGSIHGFELSGSEGALRLLQRLSTGNDPATTDVLRNVVVLIDPMLNPDGRDAFAHLNHENIGRVPSPERDDWSNDFTPWQAIKFRTGHYYFDTNRDWFAQTQRETRARLPTLLSWRPQFVIDMHEMGPDVEFYFDPPDIPYGPFFPPFARDVFRRLNLAYAAAFDSAGFQYMTRERYNYFYPGYTTSQGSYQGAAGMLYEQGSSRGLAITRPDGSVRTLADAVEHQYLAAWTAAEYAALHREELLRAYYEGHRAAIDDGTVGFRRYFILPEGDRGHIAALVNLLGGVGIEVTRLAKETPVQGVRDRAGQEVGRFTFPSGTYVIDAGQPRNRLIRALLEPDLPLPEGFLAVARHRVERDENPRFYDITAWSLPLLFDVGGYSATDETALVTTPLTFPVRPDGVGVRGRAAYAYLLDGRQAASVSALYHLTAQGHRAAVTLRDTRIAGRDVASGTVVVRVGQNDASVHDAVRDVAERFGLEAGVVATGLADPGDFPSLGSADVIPVRAPQIALLAEDPIQAYSFGWAWYTLDRQYQIPVTPVRVQSVAHLSLDRFDVLIVPSAGAGLAPAMGPQGVARVRRWIRDGGTLVTLGAAAGFAMDSSALGVIALRSWYATEQGKDAQRFRVPGAIMRVTLDRESFLTAGYADREFPALVDGARLYLPPDGAPSSRRRVVATFADDGNVKLSGHAWDESLARLPGKVFSYEERVGRGRVIVFAEDMNYRGYWRGANRMFLNAVVVGPSGN